MVDDDPTADETDELISEEPMPKEAEEFFDDFFFNFASNKRLQKERICFPLLVRSNAKTDTLQSKDWHTDHFFMHQEEYTLIFDNEEQMMQVKDTSVNHAVVEKIFLDQGFVSQYKFDRQNGRWMLKGMQKQTMSQNPNASFLEFYKRFVADSAFQVKSINKTVTFISPDPDDDFTMMEGVITPETWSAFAPTLPSKVLYNIVYGKPKPLENDMIFLMRGVANGLEQELRFKKVGGHWLLMKMAT
jgi:hypothetical protein